MNFRPNDSHPLNLWIDRHPVLFVIAFLAAVLILPALVEAM